MTAVTRPARPNITFTWEFIDPALAEAYFQQRHPDQRKVRKHRVSLYVRDLQAGHWTPSNESIAFDEEGYLVDGQHRLKAIATSGVGVWMPVARGLPRKTIANIGTGQPRGFPDTMRMSGNGDYTNSFVATAKAMRNGSWADRERGNALTATEVSEFIQKYEKPLRFAEEHTGHIVGLTRSARALVARAFLTENTERLKEWCAVLRTGMPVSANTKEDSAAIMYRDFLRRNVGSSGYEAEGERYRKGQTALRAFLDRRPMTKIYGTEEDLFPLEEAVSV